jgi:hypothetical protein
MNSIFTTLFGQQVAAFRNAYSEIAKAIFVDPASGRPSHPGEYGGYREAILQNFLRHFVPARLDMGAGFLISADGGLSTQLDLVLFDGASAPRLESNSHQRFFPVEAVVGIGEAKSSLTKAQFKEAINKLAAAKQLTERIVEAVPIRRDAVLKSAPFNRAVHAYDQIVSFLVCDSLEFDAIRLPDDIEEMYPPDLPHRCRHNLVLSLRDGLLAYVDKNKKTMMYPQIAGATLRNRFVQPDTNADIHVQFFVNYILMMTTAATVLYPGMEAYLPPTVGGWNHEQSG